MLAALTFDAQTQNVREPRFIDLNPFNWFGPKDCPLEHLSDRQAGTLKDLPAGGCMCTGTIRKECTYGNLCYKKEGCHSCAEKHSKCNYDSVEEDGECKVSAECKGNSYCSGNKCHKHAPVKPIQIKTVRCWKPTRAKCNRVINKCKSKYYDYTGKYSAVGIPSEGGYYQFVCKYNKSR